MLKPDNLKNSQGKIWLNIASSFYVLEDFVNLDNNIFLHYFRVFTFFKRFLPSKYQKTIDLYSEAKQKGLVIKHDCRKRLLFPDNSVDHILCSHFLEHVFPDEMEIILNNFFRVIKPQATLHIIVPDLMALAKQYLQDPDPKAADEFISKTLLCRSSRGSLKYRLLEFHGGFGLQHRWMYDLPSMTKKLQDIGFVILEKNATPSKTYRLADGSVHIVALKP